MFRKVKKQTCSKDTTNEVIFRLRNDKIAFIPVSILSKGILINVRVISTWFNLIFLLCSS